MYERTSPNFHFKNGVKTENFTQISLCWGATLKHVLAALQPTCKKKTFLLARASVCFRPNTPIMRTGQKCVGILLTNTQTTPKKAHMKKAPEKREGKTSNQGRIKRSNKTAEHRKKNYQDEEENKNGTKQKQTKTEEEIYENKTTQRTPKTVVI